MRMDLEKVALPVVVTTRVFGVMFLHNTVGPACLLMKGPTNSSAAVADKGLSYP